jgi:uncharacterized protein (TIRG00374 family)
VRDRPSLAGLASLLISAGLLIGLYRTLDFHLVVDVLRHANPVWLAISIAMIVPITVLRAIRFYAVAPRGTLPGVNEALRLTLVATTLNVFLPSKAGDLIKSYFVAKRGGVSAGVAVSVIVYERLCDVFGLLFWCIAGWMIARPVVRGVPAAIWPMLGALGVLCGVLILSQHAAAVVRMVAQAFRHRALRGVKALIEGWPDLLHVMQGRRRWVTLFSVLLWLVHLVQIWMFTVALSVPIPFTVCASLSAVALMAGQVPLTVAGLGARDVALVVLMEGYMTPETAAAMAILIATRGLLPPLAAVPILRPYLSTIVEEARGWRAQVEPAG